MPNEKTIDAIIDIEWEMFHSVNEGGPKASCQEDKNTFVGMRRGQYLSWSQETCDSYLEDLKNAVACGRNLPMEKYIHMMKNTAPIQYEQLEDRLTMPDEEGKKLADEITAKMISQTSMLFLTYPHVSGAGRPLYSNFDYAGTTSIETYQRGELYTYSTKTLRALHKHMFELDSKGISLAKVILENTVKHYGYTSLEQAEEMTSLYVARMQAAQYAESCCDGDCGDDGCSGDCSCCGGDCCG